ncbi:MAG: fatty acid--CoA ligase, partial [Leucobacter sp.]|nr:fatty acid--CoA ligase [Leucobacter sp.]
YLFVKDRVKDMIISGGENVYSVEVENALMAHAAVLDVAVVAIPSQQWGETPHAVVVLKPGESVDEQTLIEFAREHLAHFKCPTSVQFVDELPRNPSGKVLKRQLREPFWQAAGV